MPRPRALAHLNLCNNVVVAKGAANTSREAGVTLESHSGGLVTVTERVPGGVDTRVRVVTENLQNLTRGCFVTLAVMSSVPVESGWSL